MPRLAFWSRSTVGVKPDDTSRQLFNLSARSEKLMNQSNESSSNLRHNEKNTRFNEESVSHTFLSSYFAPLITLTGRTVKLWGEDCQKKRSFLSTHNIFKNCMSTKGRRTTKTNLIILLLEAKKSFTLEKYPQQTRFIQ